MPKITRRTFLAGGAGTALALSANPRIFVGQTNEPIRLGVITPLSGPQEFIGSFVKNGAEVAAELRQQGGEAKGRPIVLEFRDEKANPPLRPRSRASFSATASTLQLGTIRRRGGARLRPSDAG